MIYRIVYNGAIYRVQWRFRSKFWPFWFNHPKGDCISMQDAENFVATQLRMELRAGFGSWATMAVYDLYSGSDRGDSPTNAERLLRDNK